MFLIWRSKLSSAFWEFNRSNSMNNSFSDFNHCEGDNICHHWSMFILFFFFCSDFFGFRVYFFALFIHFNWCESSYNTYHLQCRSLISAYSNVCPGFYWKTRNPILLNRFPRRKPFRIPFFLKKIMLFCLTFILKKKFSSV